MTLFQKAIDSLSVFFISTGKLFCTAHFNFHNQKICESKVLFIGLLACSRLRDSGEKSFSKKKCEKRAGAGERQGATALFPKSRASYFRFARFNTSALYYLRAWHRLLVCLPWPARIVLRSRLDIFPTPHPLR